MGVKYIILNKSHDDKSWEARIETPNYNGTAIMVKGVSEAFCEIDYDGDSADDPYNVFIKSTATLNFYNEGQIDIEELQKAADKDFTLKLFKNGHIYWAGFLKPEDTQRKLVAVPYDVTLGFVCGLTLLDTIPYTHADLPVPANVSVRCPINYIRQILFSNSNLGIMLPIRWTNQLQCTAFSDDFFAGHVTWSPFGEGFLTYQQGQNGDAAGPAQTCTYILEGILKACQCRIYQARGKWIIRRVNDVVGANVFYREVQGDLNVLNITSGRENLSKRIGRAGYRFVNENQIITVKQGIKSFKTTYNANIRTNIVPNGNLDNVSLIDQFLYWGTYSDTLVIDKIPGLDGQNGFAAELTSGSSDDVYFTLISPGSVLGKNGLPIDALTLVKVINFSFMFSPGLGFPHNDQLVDWTSQPLQIQVILNQGGIQYFLNEFGYWTQTAGFINIVIDNLAIGDVAQVSFDKFQGVKVPAPASQPIAGDTCDLQIIFKVKPNETYSLDNISITIDNANDVYEVFDDSNKNTSTDNDEVNISSSFGGYMLSNFMSAWYNSDAECRFTDGLVYSGTLTGIHSHALMRFRYKASDIFNGDVFIDTGDWSFDEIYSIDSLLGKNFLPLNAKYYVEKGIVNIIAIEGRNDNITLRESFYNSNDNINSN